MGLAVAAASVICGFCSSRTFDIEQCQWCGKHTPGHEPRAPTEQEQKRHGGVNGVANEQTYRRSETRQTYNHGNDALVLEMEKFVDTYHMAASRFSRLATNGRDPYLFERVTQGGNPRAETIERIQVFMREYKKGDLF